MHPLNEQYPAAGSIPRGADIGHVHLKVSSIARPREEWAHAPDGQLHMISAPLDLEALLREADGR